MQRNCIFLRTLRNFNPIRKLCNPPIYAQSATCRLAHILCMHLAYAIFSHTAAHTPWPICAKPARAEQTHSPRREKKILRNYPSLFSLHASRKHPACSGKEHDHNTDHSQKKMHARFFPPALAMPKTHAIHSHREGENHSSAKKKTAAQNSKKAAK